MTHEENLTQEDRDFAFQRMRTALADRLSRECPCCNAMLAGAATIENGAPGVAVFEADYLCGGQVRIDPDNEIIVTAGCTRDLRRVCEGLWVDADGEREDFLDELTEMRAGGDE